MWYRLLKLGWHIDKKKGQSIKDYPLNPKLLFRLCLNYRFCPNIGEYHAKSVY